MPSPYDRSVGFRYAVLALVGVVLAGIIVWPWIERWLSLDQGAAPVELTQELAILDEIRTRGILLFLYLWVFSLGGTIGSFLNVVVWRMPRGESVAARASRCPYCCTPIRPSDNVPVLGWWMLGGRCRTCLLPISPRYPLVEVITGLMFVSLLHRLVLSGGAILPGHQPREDTAWAANTAMMHALDLHLWGQMAYWAVLLCLLITWALIAWDRQVMPLKLLVFAVMIGVLVPVGFPRLYPWEGLPGVGGNDLLADHVSAVVTLILGGWAGGAWGWLLRLLISPRIERDRVAVLPMMLAIGLFLGWQAASIVAGIAVLIVSLVWPILRRHAATTVQTATAIAIWGTTWWLLVDWQRIGTLAPLSPEQTALAAALIALAGGSLLRWWPREIPLDLARFRTESAPTEASGGDTLAGYRPEQEN